MGNSASEVPVGARADRWEKACSEAMRSCVAEGGGFASVDDALAYNYISIYAGDPEIADAVLAASGGARLPEAIRATALSHALSDLDSWDACEFRERAIAYAGEPSGTLLEGLTVEQAFDVARRCAEGCAAGPSSGPGRGRGRAM